MRYVFDHDFHIHSCLTGGRANTPEVIFNYAKENGLKTVITTDHYWDDRIPTDVNHGDIGNEEIHSLLPYPQGDGVRMLIGAEADIAPDGTLGANRRTFDDFDFILLSATHLGSSKWFPFDGTPEESIPERAKAYVRRFDAIFNADIPHHKAGITHPVGSVIGPSEELYRYVLDAIPDAEFHRLFRTAAQLGIGVEINLASMRNHTLKEMPQHTPELQPSVFRPYYIAREEGCKFFFGSDTHFPHEFSFKPATAETVIDQLELKESEKFLLEPTVTVIK